MTIVVPDSSPVEILARLRGVVIDVRPAYPETIHVFIRDRDGGLWHLDTHDAYYSPSDPGLLCGKTIVSATHEGPLGNLTIGFADGSSFRVWVDPQEAPDDPVNWRLFMPEDLVLSWGPGTDWDVTPSNSPI
jgi:hypothetical protein